MSDEPRREYEDGAFYWVRDDDEWLVARYEAPGSFWTDGAWWTTGGDLPLPHPPDEIGPCLGKEPPRFGAEYDVPPLYNAASHLDGMAAWYGRQKAPDMTRRADAYAQASAWLRAMAKPPAPRS